MTSETLLEKLFRKILQQGSIPNHVAIVLDGLCSTVIEDMHGKGICRLSKDIGRKSKVDKIVDWGVLCGVQEITLYTFSIKNFERTAKEVSQLMDLFRDHIGDILRNDEDMVNGRACYQIIGDWSLFPNDLKPLIAKLMVDTRQNRKITVNFAFVYTGRNEIISGVKHLLNGVANKALTLSDVNENLLDKSLQLYSMSPVDLLIRTGECRLSDFLPWGSSDHAFICFRDEYWPSFSYWGLLASIFYYQANEFRIPHYSKTDDKVGQQSGEFLRMLKKKLWETVKNNDERQGNFGVQ